MYVCTAFTRPMLSRPIAVPAAVFCLNQWPQ